MNHFSPRPIFVTLLLVAAVLVAARPAIARPDFESSEISSESTSVTEGDVAHFKVVLRNRGDEPAEAVEVIIPFPTMGHLIEVKGLDDVRTDHESREVTAKVSLPMNAERMVDLALLTPRDAAGHLLSLTVRIIHFHTMAETWIHGKVEIDTRARSDGLRIGGLRVAPAGVLVLGWLLVTGISLTLAGRFTRQSDSGRFFGPHAGVMALMISLGFWMIFAAMGWYDYEVLFHWKETTGEIVGRRVTLQSVNSNHRLSSGATSQSRHSDVAKPEFAVRDIVDGHEVLSSGYDTGSSLRVGGGKAQLEKEFQEWTVGSRVVCWYDPNEPKSMVVKRGFGGAYLFALLPLFPFWMGWRILRG